MAELIKYLDLKTGLPQLVTEIKGADAKVLADAKKYTDDKGKLYESAGAAATAEQNAKDYADEKVGALAEGAVKTNTEAIAKLNGDADVEGSVDKKVADAKSDLQGKIDAVDAKTVKNAEDIAAINNEETGILKQAKDHTNTEVAKVQGAVDSLKTYVGTLPENATAKDVIGYVNEKTANIASDSKVNAIESRVAQAEKDIDALEADHLVAADKTELEGKIETAQAKADQANGKADTNAAAIKAIQDDYLVEADKTELQSNIDAVGAKVTTLVGEDANKSVRTIANEELAAQLLSGKADADFKTLQELAAWLEDHPEDVAAINLNIDNLKKLVGTLPEGATATNIVGYIQEAVAAEKTRAEQAESKLGERITTLEGKFSGEGSVEDKIADAQAAAEAHADAVAKEKADAALADAKAYTNAEVGKDRARLDALEAVDHDHVNKAELDLIATGDKAKWDAAAAKAHEHANKAELDKIAVGDKAKWDAAEQNAKTYADGLNTEMTSKVDGAIERIAKNETDIVNANTEIAKKAAKTDLDAAVARISANETAIKKNADDIALKASQADLDVAEENIATNAAGIAANKAKLDAMVAITAEEVTGLFA